MTFPVMWRAKAMQRSHLHRYCWDCTWPWPLHSTHRLRLTHKEQFLAVPAPFTQCKAEFSLGLEALSELCTTVSCHGAFKQLYHPRIWTSSEHKLEACVANVCSAQEILLKISYKDVDCVLLDDTEIVLHLLIIPSKSMEI